MDPLSITASSLAIISAIAKTSATVTKFARSVRDAREDVTATSLQLSELSMVIDLLHNDLGDETRLPEGIRTVSVHIESVLGNCKKILVELDTLVTTFDSRRMQWALSGKSQVVALNSRLDAHTKALQIALDVSTLSVAHFSV